MTPEAYNERELLEGRLTIDHVESLVRLWQREHGLVVDGKMGPVTRISVAGAGRLASMTAPLGRRLRAQLSPNADAADHYNAGELAAGRFSHQHLTTLVRHWQAKTSLDADGKAGPATRATLDQLGPGLRLPPPVVRCYPLALLPDMRKPQITSRYKDNNPDRKTHDGVDLFYRWQESDGLVPVGDGGATRDKDGKPKWFIPKGTKAISPADGVVVRAGDTQTGHRVWIQHYDGTSTGCFHLYDEMVQLGERVIMGQPLGTVGDNPADRDAKHLHFETVKGAVGSMNREQYKAALVDPETWLEGASFIEAA